MVTKYKLRFFFDYNDGGCLWCDNDAAFQKFGSGVLDTDLIDLKGQVLQDAKIKLPEHLKRKVEQLDKLFAQSLDWNNPAGESLWDTNQWADFHNQATELHKEISMTLGDQFEISYQQK
ncbi:MAG: hypothetical protein ACXWC7_02665 [Chitinophagaceae bacterium]